MTMTTMKAAIRTGFFGNTLTFTHDHPRPTLTVSDKKNKKDTSSEEILVKIHSAAINPIDYKAPRSFVGTGVGFDFCGTVEQVNVNENALSSHGLKKGDLVYGGCKGSLSEYAIASVQSVAKAPQAASSSYSSSHGPWKPSELASLFVAHQSALQCLKRGKIIIDNDDDDGEGYPTTTDKTVLIIGASGGCGIAGIQLCKAVGVKRIIAICSGKNAQLVRDMGATEVVDYTNETELKQFFESNVGAIDCVYDAATNSGAGEDYWSKSIPLLKEGVGEYTALNGPALKWIRCFTGYEKERESLIMMKPNTADLELIVKLMDRIDARPLVNIMPFTEDGFHEAFRLLKSRRVKGKIAFDICCDDDE